MSKIIPIFKKGDPKSPSNYRPISVLSSFSKIYEEAVSLKITEFLQTNNLIDNEQHCFRSVTSIISASVTCFSQKAEKRFECIESVLDSVDKGDNITGVFMDLDLYGAFDSVSHSDK